MSKARFINLMSNEVHSLERRRFLMKGALVPLIPMAAILPGAISMNAVASGGASTLLILNNGTRFNGLGEDQLLSMQHLGNGYRIYNPTLMRFQAMDSLAPFNEGGPNSYAYLSGDPLNFIDPTGHVKERVVNQIALIKEKNKKFRDNERDKLLVIKRGRGNALLKNNGVCHKDMVVSNQPTRRLAKESLKNDESLVSDVETRKMIDEYIAVMNKFYADDAQAKASVGPRPSYVKAAEGRNTYPSSAQPRKPYFITEFSLNDVPRNYKF